MKLIELEIIATEPSGWGSGIFTFGDAITQLYGPNGSGKTPMIQSLVFALGYPVSYREDIKAKCESVRLRIEGQSGKLEIIRKISDKFDTTCNLIGGSEKWFGNENDFSAYLFDYLGMETTTLITKQGAPVPPYASTFLPLFYLDQNDGYTDYYKPKSSFIRNQLPEMVRLAFKLPPSAPYDKSQRRARLRSDLSELDAKIAREKERLESLREHGDGVTRDTDLISEEIDKLNGQMLAIRNSDDFNSEAVSSIDLLMREKRRQLAEINEEINDHEMRALSYGNIVEEINIEINTLSLNEEARRLFTEMCSSDGCQLFAFSQEAYGKNLLYLKDQVKDLERYQAYSSGRVEELKLHAHRVEEDVASLGKTKNELAKDLGISGLIGTVRSLVERVVELEQERKKAEDWRNQFNKVLGFEEQRNSAYEKLQSMSPNSSSLTPEVSQLLMGLTEKVIRWMDILNTKNVSRSVFIDVNFAPTYGGERLSAINGSTRLRVVLAFHAALFETLLEKHEDNFRVLIFDTPRQHDIDAHDFGTFIKELHETAIRHEGQVIFSTTDYHYVSAGGDSEWQPAFDGVEQKMFLGPLH